MLTNEARLLKEFEDISESVRRDLPNLGRTELEELCDALVRESYDALLIKLVANRLVDENRRLVDENRRLKEERRS